MDWSQQLDMTRLQEIQTHIVKQQAQLQALIAEIEIELLPKTPYHPVPIYKMVRRYLTLHK